jgi:plasmid maintenance system killer protein
LEFAFESKDLRTLCEDQARAKASLGDVAAHALKNRLADLRAATHAADLPAGRPRPLDESDRNQMAVDLSDGYRLVFAANHRQNPTAGSGEVDWQRVTRVKILRIDKEHG